MSLQFLLQLLVPTIFQLNFGCNFLFQLFTAIQRLANNVRVHTKNIKAMEHKWHPNPSALHLWPVVGNQLIGMIHTIHCMIVVINHFWNLDLMDIIISPEFLYVVFVTLGFFLCTSTTSVPVCTLLAIVTTLLSTQQLMR